ncbi:MAG: SseB family protein [Eubacteriales bacterium]|nr:SseB family protein [Eubacteriales bacterium]
MKCYCCENEIENSVEVCPFCKFEYPKKEGTAEEYEKIAMAKAVEYRQKNHIVPKSEAAGVNSEGNETVKKLQSNNQLFVAYCQYTNLPFVTCDEESFDDQAHIFTTEDEIREYGKVQAEQKMLILGMSYNRADFPRLYGLLYSIGVNSVVLHDNGTTTSVPIESIARRADFSKLEENKRPLINESLQLSAIYFMQEMRKPGQEKTQERAQMLREKEEELLANFRRSEFLIPTLANPSDPKKVAIPFLKNKEGQTMQPICTDAIEVDKYQKMINKQKNPQKIRVLRVPFEKLPDLLIKEAHAFVFNPFGFNLPLTKEQIQKILGR